MEDPFMAETELAKARAEVERLRRVEKYARKKVDWAETEIERLRAALQFYADRTNYQYFRDYGEIARRTLADEQRARE